MTSREGHGLNLLFTIPQGQCIRDFLVLGIVERVLDALPEAQAVLLTPSHQVPQFLDLCPTNRVKVRRMESPTSVGANERLLNLRLRLRRRWSIRQVLQLEARRLAPPGYLLDTFREIRPQLVVTTHPMPTHDYQVVMTARKLGIQTAGVVKSWDNVGKGLAAQPHLLSVWGPVNRNEAIQLRGYSPDEVTINGGASFDPYYDPSWLQPRSDFLCSLGLDPARPVITYATCGVYDRGYFGRDETFLVDDLLRMIENTPQLKGAQLVIRLHPMSRLEYFWRFQRQKDVRFSFASYMPAIGWYTSRDDVIEQTNLLKHSDAIVTPASSWAIEAAILGTPTVCPVYSEIQPEHARAQFDQITLARHFRPLLVNRWVPITRSYDETCGELVDAIRSRDKFADGRKAIVDNYVHFRGPGSVERVSGWIVANARRAMDGKLRGL